MKANAIQFTEDADNPQAAYRYLPCYEYILKSIDARGMSAEDARDYVEFRLPRFFPEVRENIVFDFLPPDPAEPDRRTAIIAKKSSIFPAGQSSKNAKAVLTLVNGFAAPDGNFLRVVRHGQWAEWAIRTEGTWGACRHEASGELPLGEWSRLASEGTFGTIQIIQDDDAPAFDHSTLALETGTGDGLVIETATFTEALAPKAGRLFSARPGARNRARNRVAIACCLLGCAILNYGLFHARSEYEAGGKILEKEIRASNDLRKQYQTAEKRLAELTKGGATGLAQAPTPFGVLSALAAANGVNLRISSFSCDAARVSIIAECDSALEYVNILAKTGAFANLKLSNVKPGADGKESFYLTGDVNVAK